MSVADQIFINMCKDILENGTSTEGEKVRPHWAKQGVGTERVRSCLLPRTVSKNS